MKVSIIPNKNSLVRRIMGEHFTVYILVPLRDMEAAEASGLISVLFTVLIPEGIPKTQNKVEAQWT